MKSCTSRLVGFFLLGLLALPSCNGRKAASDTDATNMLPRATLLGNFNSDSAYRYVAEQVNFGPRVPGSAGHRACRDYIISKLKSFDCDTLIVQDAVVEAYNGDKLPISNIIASYNKNARRRILLVAHWDTRPWADMSISEERRNTPVPGANDGGSGTAVLLEIARNLGMKSPNVGVDLLFVDAEDYGDSRGFGENEDTWCLGTQYWVANMTPYTRENMPVYGILLDMVGGIGAVFHYENFSQQYARTITDKVWSEAERLGHGDRFIQALGGAVTDDHIFLTRAGIPTTDIIESNNVETQSFPPTWHTLRDNMNNISHRSLQAVGETVLNVVYKEPAY